MMAAATGAARSQLAALPCANGAVGLASAMGLAQPERPPRMAAPLAAPMLARKRGLEALGWVPQPLSRPPSQRPPPERAIIACGAARAMVPRGRPPPCAVGRSPPRRDRVHRMWNNNKKATTVFIVAVTYSGLTLHSLFTLHNSSYTHTHYI